MELLIPGLILVALMVWASTRIKRNAAAAFEEESIDNDDFSFAKPDGFLHVLNDNSGLPFRAYSKEYGTDEANGIRRAEIEIEIFKGFSAEERLASVETEAKAVSDVRTYLEAGESAMTFSATLEKNNVGFERFYKLVTRGNRLFELRATVIDEHKDDFARRIEEVVDGFHAK